MSRENYVAMDDREVIMRRIKSILKNLIYNYISLKYLLDQEKNSKVKIPIKRKITYLLNGFSSSKYELYDFRNNNHKLYLSDFQRQKTMKINGAHSLILNDKFIFGEIFKGLSAEIFGRIKKGKIYLNNKESDIYSLKNLISIKKEIIIKRNRGGGGKGIHRLAYIDKNIFLDDNLVSLTEIEKFIKSLSDYIIMEHLSQLDYSNNIYDGTINSIRVLTMIDPKTNEPFIAIAVHKFGSKKTEPVDNVWKGGMTALVDLETGALRRPAYHRENNNKIDWIHEHPDTKIRIEGTVIPHWTSVKDSIMEIASKHDYLKYVGWDIVVTQEGIKIIEGNNYSDVNILQIHQPLLEDERVRRFYQHHKIIS